MAVKGRPTKLTEHLLVKFQEVLDDGQNALLCTDEELTMLLNEKLEPEERISDDSFQRYKSGHTTIKKDLTEEQLLEIEEKNTLMASFCGLYKKALMKQRDSLFESLKKDDKAWQKRAWIIERKFDDWNIRNKQEMSGPNGGPIEQVTTFSLPENKR